MSAATSMAAPSHANSGEDKWTKPKGTNLQLSLVTSTGRYSNYAPLQFPSNTSSPLRVPTGDLKTAIHTPLPMNVTALSVASSVSSSTSLALSERPVSERPSSLSLRQAGISAYTSAPFFPNPNASQHQMHWFYHDNAQGGTNGMVVGSYENGKGPPPIALNADGML
jgi:hypothetical protein